MPKISVVIPVYNVGKYLARCLDSVINQTFKDIEIICINDCSPDNSAEILQEYAEKESKIKIVNRKENGGLSAARHSGLDVAGGEYIYFLDSDDWIELDFLEKMYLAITTQKQKVVCCTNVVSVMEDGSTKQMIKRDFDEGIFPYYKSCQMAWSWLLKKDFLDEFEVIFPLGLKYEDTYFFNVLIRSLENVYIINSTTYYHFENKNSIMGNSKDRIIKDFDIIKIIELIYDYYKRNDLLKKWTIPFFYMPKYMINIHQNKSEFYLKLKEFFLEIKDSINAHKNLYTDLELTFFYEVIDSLSYEDYKVKQVSVIGALRKKVINSKVKNAGIKE